MKLDRFLDELLGFFHRFAHGDATRQIGNVGPIPVLALFDDYCKSHGLISNQPA
jgi:hypothetical protein